MNPAQLMLLLKLPFYGLLITCVFSKDRQPAEENCQIKQVCLGHDVERSASGNTVAEILQDLHQDFCGCKTISGNIHVVMHSKFPDLKNASLTEENFTFFSEIIEVTGYIFLQGIPTLTELAFPQLRLIRGMETINGGQLALAIGQSSIDTLYMPKLTEITNGGVLFGDSTPPLCNVDSVNWTDIINSGVYTNDNNCNGQKPNCTMCSSGHCWCSNNAEKCCQKLSRTICLSCGNRCVRDEKSGHTQCCPSDCAAGCTGVNRDECQACRKLNNNGTCVNTCPPEFVLDQTSGHVVPNPEFRVQVGTQCTELPCPEGLFRLHSLCVMQCPTHTHQSKHGECVVCNGLCPKECAGGSVTTSNPADRLKFINCTIVNGNLHVGIQPIMGFSESTLSILSSIEVIRGTLSIQHWPFETFPYLSNLHTLGSNNANLLSLNRCHHDNGSHIPYALVVSDNSDLITIDLSSLQEIQGGSVYLHNNKQLCLIGNFTSLLTNTSSQVCITKEGRREPQECVSTGVVCNAECADNTMCWGTSANQCISCRNYLYLPNSTCVSSCENISSLNYRHFYSDSHSRQCQLCHPLCDGKCTGKGPSNCSACLKPSLFVNHSNIIECVNHTCPVGWYDGRNGQCESCFEGCSTSGCAGPLPYVSISGGCLSCSTIILNRLGEQVMCRVPHSNDVCPSGYYQEQQEIDNGEIKSGTILCRPCHQSCDECVGPSNNQCMKKCTRTFKNGTCACEPSEIFNNLTKICEAQSMMFSVTTIAGGAVGIFTIVVTVILFALLAYKCFKTKSSTIAHNNVQGFSHITARWYSERSEHTSDVIYDNVYDEPKDQEMDFCTSNVYNTIGEDRKSKNTKMKMNVAFDTVQSMDTDDIYI